MPLYQLSYTPVCTTARSHGCNSLPTGRRGDASVASRRGNLPVTLVRVSSVTVMANQQFEALYRANFARLVAIGVTMSGDQEVARDLAQEAMIRAHDRWHELASFDQPAAWLRRVMVNLLISHHRRATSEQTMLGRVARLRTADHRDAADASTDADVWRALVASLPMQQRAIIVLHYGDDRSVDEVADLLDISSGTVKSTLSKARRKLRALATEGADHG